MKRHLLGFCIALFTFFGSFYVSPIRFYGTAIAHGYTNDGSDWCGFYPHLSNHFTKVYASSCDYKTKELAIQNLNKKVGEAFEIVEPAREIEAKDGRKIQRAVIVLREDDANYFCIIRTDGNWEEMIYSTSLRHVLEFEQQKSNK